MKTKSLILIAATLTGLAFSAHAESYQATGPVIEVTDAKIVIQKGKEKWEFARNADTKVTGDLKVGEKATVQYSMVAASVDVKADKAAKPAAKPAAAPAKPAATPAAPAAPATPAVPAAPKAAKKKVA